MTYGLDGRCFDLALVLWRSLVNEVRRDGLLGVLLILLVKGSRPLLIIGLMSGKINGILICDPELFVTLGKLLTRKWSALGNHS